MIIYLDASVSWISRWCIPGSFSSIDFAIISNLSIQLARWFHVQDQLSRKKKDKLQFVRKLGI
jgi:hypothetical protein